MTHELSIVDIDGDGQNLRAVAILLTDKSGGQVELARDTYFYDFGKGGAIRTALELANVALQHAMTAHVTLPDGREVSRRYIESL